MIYDCFSFFNELDLLEIRLNYLNKYVDKFVLVEMNKTHSNLEKPFFFEENKSRFEKFSDKIIHIKVTDAPEPKNKYDGSWQLENYQRDCIMCGLENAQTDDIIIISDLDEIPSVTAIDAYKTGIMSLSQRMTYYYLNLMNINEPRWVRGTKICHLSDLLEPDRDISLLFGNNYTKKGLPTYIRFYDSIPFAEGGWHFSYLGGAEQIAYKIKSFAHQELNIEAYTNIDNIKANVMQGKDLFDRNYSFKPIPIDDTFPDYIVNNQEKYKHLIIPV